MTDAQAIREALREAIRAAQDVLRRNRADEGVTVSTAYDEGRVSGLVDALELVDDLTYRPRREA